MGLEIPAPDYGQGVYISTHCRPTPSEVEIFRALGERKMLRVRDSLALIGDGTEAHLKDDRAIKHWVRSRLTRSMGTIPAGLDLTFLCKYSEAAGFMLALDSARNLAKPKVPFALLSLVPPASVYLGADIDATLRPCVK